MPKDLKCYRCGYKRDVPGNAHVACKYDWYNTGTPPMEGDPHGVKKDWYFFPLLFDPVWMLDECTAFDEVADERFISDAAGDFIIAGQLLQRSS